MKAELKVIRLGADVVTVSGCDQDYNADNCPCFDPEDIGEVCAYDQ